jgi:hypothetical protein
VMGLGWLVGVSYTWDDGEKGLKNAERPAVFVKKVGDEVKVRFLSVLERVVLVTNVGITAAQGLGRLILFEDFSWLCMCSIVCMRVLIL